MPTLIKNNLSLIVALLFTFLCMTISVYTPLDNSLIAGGMTILWLITYSASEYYLGKHLKKAQHDS